MYWGNSLLFDWGNLGDKLADLGYWIINLLPRMFYAIWRMLASIVAGIEGIFRNLAGVGGTNKDMVTEIINNKSVQAIFGNLVSLSTAVIVFFTIIKIIQDHYKEKDGGNPYKIVLRTFKGLLMFFFVNAAVSVGLMASQTMFKALDAATGSGSSSIAGQVFKIMAEPANRRDDAYDTSDEDDEDGSTSTGNRYWMRVNDQTSKLGSYFMTEVSDNGKGKTQAELAAQYLEAFPIAQYGVVVGDGTKVVPLAQYLNTADDSDDTPPSFKDQIWNDITKEYSRNEGETKYEGGSTGMNASVGFKSDFLRGVDLMVTPSINLAWSPIDIDDYYFSLKQSNKIDHNVQVLVHGYGVLIPMSTQMVKFDQPTVKTKSLEDSAKQFGISLSGGVALQDGTASASFNLDTFDISKFGQILQSICLNVVYTNVLTTLMQVIPNFPGETSVGPLVVNYIQMFGPVITNMFGTLIQSIFKELVPVDEDGNPLVEVFSNNATGHNSGIWSIMNPKSKTLDTTIEQYRIDHNFKDLWSQLDDTFDMFKNQLETAAATAYEKIDESVKELEARSKRVREQQDWIAYKAVVDDYNEYAIGALNRLGNLFALRDAAIANHGNTISASHTEYIQSQGYSGAWSKLESDIKSTFVELVTRYNNNVEGRKPSTTYADPRIVPSIYKPVIEFGFTENFASSLDVDNIYAVLTDDRLHGNWSNPLQGGSGGTGMLSDGNHNIKVNLVLDETGVYGLKGGYRVVDFKAYGPLYTFELGNTNDPDLRDGIMKNVADLTCEHGLENSIYENNSLEELAVVNLVPNAALGWEGKGGVLYFLGYGDSQFSKSTLLSNQLVIQPDSYWGSNGIVLNMDATHPVYFHYEGVTYNPIKGAMNNLGITSVEDTDLHTSSAHTNEVLQQGQVAQNQFLDLMTTDTDTVSPLANKFAENIITFRRLTPTEDGGQPKDKKALKEWCKTKGRIECTGTHTEEMLYNMTSEKINDLMASGDGARRYLMQTQRGTTEAAEDCSNWGSYIGQLSWKDDNTVNALYNWWKMHYVIGFIAIVAAVGVYLNFAFGLIQRAVNMAVLFMLSPVSIAFYPFDDGSKFNNAFVKPFYNEAISAFAVIVSLNLFVVLFNPLQSAVAEATGSNVLGWLTLVAFVSMLPQIRNTVVSILGGGKIGEKSLSDTVKVAAGVISAPRNDIKGLAGGAGKKIAHAGDTLMKGGVMARELAKGVRGRETARLLEKQRNGNLSWWGERRLNKIDQGSYNASQKRIDEARAALGTGISKVKYGDEAVKGLTRSEVRRMKRQDAAATTRAQAMVRKKDYADDKKYQDAVDKQKADLLESGDFKKSVNGVVAATRVGQAATRFGGGAKKVGGAVGNGLKVATGKIAGTNVSQNAGEMLHGIGSKLRYSFVGQAIANKYGIDGSKTKDKDSFLGMLNRFRSQEVKEEYKNEVKGKLNKRESYRKAAEADMVSAFNEASNANQDANNANQKATREIYAREITAKAATKDKYNELLVADLMQSGKVKNLESARAQVYAKTANMSPSEIEADYKKLGGDYRYAQGVANGRKDYSVQIDAKSSDVQNRMAEISKELNLNAGLGSGKLDAVLKNAQTERKNDVQNTAINFAKDLGTTSDANIKDITNVLDNAGKHTTFGDITNSLSEKLGKSTKEIEEKLAKYYDNFAKNVQFNNQIEKLQTAKSIAGFRATEKEKLKSKFGDLANTPEVQALYQNFKNLKDGDLNSTNEQSLGYKLNNIIQQHGGNTDDPTCKQAMEQTKAVMEHGFMDTFNAYTDKHYKEILDFGSAKKFGEEMSAANMKMLEEIQQQRERILKTMDVSTQKMMLNDGKIQKMHEEGDYAGAGRLIQQLVNAIYQHDEATIKKLGFDANTVNTLKKWEAEGDEKNRLKTFAKLGAYDASHMGSRFSNMGGSTIQGMETALALLTSLAEQKTMQQMLTRAISSHANEESAARNRVNRAMNSIPTLFSGTEFNELLGKVKDSSGKAVNNKEDLLVVLRQNLEAINNDSAMEHDQYVAENMKALSDLKTKQPENIGLVNAITSFQDAVADAVSANKAADLTDASNTEYNQISARISEIIEKKLKEFSGGKH